MIKLNKSKLPAELQRLSDQWSAELAKCIEAGIKAKDSLLDNYRHREFKSRLIEETQNKCAYCESKIRHIAPGDVEHIIPKSVKTEKRFEWKNLTLACPECNNAKGDYYSEEFPLVDPFEDNPENEIIFAGHTIQDSECTAKGQTTRREIDLNRQELRDERERRLSHLGDKIKDFKRSGATAYEKHAALLNIWDFAQKSEPYAGMCRQYIRARQIESDPKERPID